MTMYQPDPDRLSTDKTSGDPMPFDVEAFTRTARELVEQGDRVPAQRYEEITPEEARAMCLREIERATEADSLDHMVMHLETAVIWARGADWPNDDRKRT